MPTGMYKAVRLFTLKQKDRMQQASRPWLSPACTQLAYPLDLGDCHDVKARIEGGAKPAHISRVAGPSYKLQLNDAKGPSHVIRSQP